MTALTWNRAARVVALVAYLLAVATGLVGVISFESMEIVIWSGAIAVACGVALVALEAARSRIRRPAPYRRRDCYHNTCPAPDVCRSMDNCCNHLIDK